MEDGYNFKDPPKIKVDRQISPATRRFVGDMILTIIGYILCFGVIWFCDKLFNDVGYIVNYWHVAKDAIVLLVMFLISLIILRNGRRYPY